MLCKELPGGDTLVTYLKILKNIWGSNNSYRINLSLESVSKKVKLLFLHKKQAKTPGPRNPRQVDLV